jgi:hypothetical protein
MNNDPQLSQGLIADEKSAPPLKRTTVKSTVRTNWISLRVVRYHWKGLKKDINRFMYVFDFLKF